MWSHSIPRSIPKYQEYYVEWEYPGLLRGLLSFSHNIVMDLNNVMGVVQTHSNYSSSFMNQPKYY